MAPCRCNGGVLPVWRGRLVLLLMCLSVLHFFQSCEATTSEYEDPFTQEIKPFAEEMENILITSYEIDNENVGNRLNYEKYKDLFYKLLKWMDIARDWDSVVPDLHFLAHGREKGYKPIGKLKVDILENTENPESSTERREESPAGDIDEVSTEESVESSAGDIDEVSREESVESSTGETDEIFTEETEEPLPTDTDKSSTGETNEHHTKENKKHVREVAKEHPTEAVKHHPTEAVEVHPKEVVKHHPTEAAKEHPTEAVKHHPTEAVEVHPKEVKHHPTEAAKEHPTEAAKEHPTEAAKEHPTEGPPASDREFNVIIDLQDVISTLARALFRK